MYSLHDIEVNGAGSGRGVWSVKLESRAGEHSNAGDPCPCDRRRVCILKSQIVRILKYFCAKEKAGRSCSPAS